MSVAIANTVRNVRCDLSGTQYNMMAYKDKLYACVQFHINQAGIRTGVSGISVPVRGLEELSFLLRSIR
jgi:hypothetical protein